MQPACVTGTPRVSLRLTDGPPAAIAVTQSSGVLELVRPHALKARGGVACKATGFGAPKPQKPAKQRTDGGSKQGQRRYAREGQRRCL